MWCEVAWSDATLAKHRCKWEDKPHTNHECVCGARYKDNKKVIHQQCKLGVDSNPESVIHMPHWHTTKHGREVWCKGWIPLTKVNTAFIEYHTYREDQS